MYKYHNYYNIRYIFVEQTFVITLKKFDFFKISYKI